MSYIVGHLLFHHLVLLDVRDIVHRHLAAVVRIDKHLEGIDTASFVDIVLEHRHIVHPRIRVAGDKLRYRLEDLAVPQCVQIRSRPVKHEVHELYKFGIGIHLPALLGEYGYASVIIVQMEKKPFLLQGYYPVALLQPVIALKHLHTYVAQL